jgi:hypothetical protein
METIHELRKRVQADEERDNFRNGLLHFYHTMSKERGHELDQKSYEIVALKNQLLRRQNTIASLKLDNMFHRLGYSTNDTVITITPEW